MRKKCQFPSCIVRFIVQSWRYTVHKAALNCQSEVAVFEVKKEKSHKFVRYVLPKGKTLNPYTKEDITPLMNNINSIRRNLLGNKSPYETAPDKSMFRLMELMGPPCIPADEINLTPALPKRYFEPIADSGRNIFLF